VFGGSRRAQQPVVLSALVLNLRWLYLSSVAGGVLMVVYGLITLGDVVAAVASGTARASSH